MMLSRSRSTAQALAPSHSASPSLETFSVISIPLLRQIQSDDQWEELWSRSTQTELVFDRLPVGSEIFRKVFKQCQKNQKTPCFVISHGEWLNSEDIEKWIIRGAHFAVLLNKDMGVASLEKAVALADKAKAIRWVLLGRKDSDVVNRYRSFPFILRDQLYVDFPEPLRSHDLCYSVGEMRSCLSQMINDIPFAYPRSFCPDLRSHSQDLQNLSADIQVISWQGSVDWVAPDQEIRNRRKSSIWSLYWLRLYMTGQKLSFRMAPRWQAKVTAKPLQWYFLILFLKSRWYFLLPFRKVYHFCAYQHHTRWLGKSPESYGGETP